MFLPPKVVSLFDDAVLNAKDFSSYNFWIYKNFRYISNPSKIMLTNPMLVTSQVQSGRSWINVDGPRGKIRGSESGRAWTKLDGQKNTQSGRSKKTQRRRFAKVNGHKSKTERSFKLKLNGPKGQNWTIILPIWPSTLTDDRPIQLKRPFTFVHFGLNERQLCLKTVHFWKDRPLSSLWSPSTLDLTHFPTEK